MKTTEDIEIELKQLGISKKIKTYLSALIDVKNYEQHTKTRKEMVQKGEKILPAMHKLMKSDHKVIRKEAIKIIELIAHKSSIPFVIKMLEDHETEIRWIAAEALIRIGRPSIRPLLEELVKNGTSYYLRQGAHHVLSSLVKEKDSDELIQLVHVLKNEIEIPERVPIDAANALAAGSI